MPQTLEDCQELLEYRRTLPAGVDIHARNLVQEISANVAIASLVAAIGGC